MSKVAIYRFRKYDISSDGYQTSHRWGTREGIDSVGGEVIDGTATEVDASAINSDIPGLTVRDFIPHPRTGFQTVVTA